MLLFVEKYKERFLSDRWLLGGAALFLLLIYVTHMQVSINGLNNPYTIDVGEIQNALPRWGTLHFTGYPQYTFIGSLFVTIVGWLGLGPAAGASLYSAVWGVVSIVILVWVINALNVPTPYAIVPALLFGLSGSMWIDATIAEIHTMTMALTFATLLTAVRFGENGSTKDLYWLAFLSGQGLAHQRAFAFVGLGLFILVINQWRVLLNWKRLLMVIFLMLLGPLTYLYLPIRAWMGAEWTFSSPGTWEGFKTIILDTKAERIINIPTSIGDWWGRFKVVLQILNADWPWPAWVLGLLGLLLPGRAWRIRLGLTFAWIPFFLVSLIIWIGDPSDAVLAAKMPVIGLSAVGLAFLLQFVWQHSRPLGYGTFIGLLILGGYLFVTRREPVLAITRDESAFEIIELVEAIPPAEDGRPQTFMALWGNDYWSLAYAQTYLGYFPELNIIEHDRNFAAVVERGEHLLTLSRTFYERPISWWENLLGPVYLTAAAPDIVEIQVSPDISAVSAENIRLDLANGIAIKETNLEWIDEDTLHLTVDWLAQQDGLNDYSIAVHLVAHDPPTSPEDILAQADRNHPVAGWYPTSLWQTGEVVTTQFLLDVPDGTTMPAAVRVGMFQVLADGSFENSEWLSLPIP